VNSLIKYINDRSSKDKLWAYFGSDPEYAPFPVPIIGNGYKVNHTHSNSVYHLCSVFGVSGIIHCTIQRYRKRGHLVFYYNNHSNDELILKKPDDDIKNVVIKAIKTLLNRKTYVMKCNDWIVASMGRFVAE
jgi:hypothetical protein